jgi:hypothetical protein
MVDVKELESLMLFSRRYRFNKEKLGTLVPKTEDEVRLPFFK